MTWRHDILFDDSLSQRWHQFSHGASARLNRTVVRGWAGPASECTHSLQVNLMPGGHHVLHSDAEVASEGAAKLSLQFWARAASPELASERCAAADPQRAALGWSCDHGKLCLSLRRSSIGKSSAAFFPLCAFGSLREGGWSKFVVPVSAFQPSFGRAARAGFDEVVLLASRRGAATTLLLDDAVLVSAARPPRPPRAFATVASAGDALGGGRGGADGRRADEVGYCQYLSSEFRRPSSSFKSSAAAGVAGAPACRVLNGDHLRGRWVQNCAPSSIKRPDRYAYNTALGRTLGQWDYRTCFKMGYAERERSRLALSWTWQPERCSLAPLDGRAFSEWLGRRRLLFWGDSLTGQHFYSMVHLLGGAVTSIRDFNQSELSARGAAVAATARVGDGGVCEYTGLGAEGGPYTEAVLEGGGVLVKVLGHAEMVSQAKQAAGAWWRPAWEAADLIVFNMVSHHLRTLDGSFRGYGRMATEAAAQLAALAKPRAQLVMRTTNIGHTGCEHEAAPLPSRSAAWARLGGWAWRPPGYTPSHYGAERKGPDPYDWRAPPLHERVWARALRSSPFAGRFAFLNVSHVDARADAHVARAMSGHTDRAKASANTDCLHYCLPGPTDAWAVALANLLLNNQRFSGRLSTSGPSSVTVASEPYPGAAANPPAPAAASATATSARCSGDCAVRPRGHGSAAAGRAKPKGGRGGGRLGGAAGGARGRGGGRRAAPGGHY